MNQPGFIPRIGTNWETDRVLVISESVYDWLDDEGTSYAPQPSHPSDSVAWNIKNFGKTQYFTSMNRALCRDALPSAEQMQEAWDQVAYTIFVQESVGLGPGAPTNFRAMAEWRKASLVATRRFAPREGGNHR